MKERIDNSLNHLLKFGQEIDAGLWQGTEQLKDEKMIEVLNHTFTAHCPETSQELIDQVEPDKPWAEDHFQERICGSPLNPGVTYKYWPYNHFMDKDDPYLKNGMFSHTYMERYCRTLDDTIYMLQDNINTRQAYMAVWNTFDLELGLKHERIPCSLGYHFIYRNGALHCNYYIRSCDIYRHFRNDIYLTLRLMQHVAGVLGVYPGQLTMYITSLHMFANNMYHLKKDKRWNIQTEFPGLKPSSK